MEFVQIQWAVREEHYSRRTCVGDSFTLGSTQLACSCCWRNHKLASACARQLSSPQTPVVLIATADLEVAQPPYRFRRRWLLYLSLVCTSLSDARSDVATGATLGMNVGKWCNISATMAPEINHAKEVIMPPCRFSWDFPMNKASFLTS